MSFSGNLLSKSQYNPRFISLVPSKDQESEISSEDDHPSPSMSSKQNISSHHHHHVVQKNQQAAHKTKKYFYNLLQMPSRDYPQMSQLYLQKKIEEKIRKNHEKELYYGKTKDKIIQISDVSSEEEDMQEKREKKRAEDLNQFEEDQENIIRRYDVYQEGKQKKTQKTRQTRSNARTHQRNRIEEKPQNSKPSKINKKTSSKKEQNQTNPLAHLHPDYENQNESVHHHNQESSQELSQIGSDKSLIIIRRKKKHILKRLKKHVNITNRVKIQNKQNQGQTHECPICLTDLNKKTEKKKGKLPCKHMFCLKCITESSKFSNRCPYCRASYNEIRSNGKRIQVEDTHLNEQYEDPDDEPCYICGRNNDFEHLLECQFCQFAYCHTYCDPRLNNRRQLPEEAWHCASCEQLLRQRDENGQIDEQDQQEQEMEQEGVNYEYSD